MHRNTNQGLRYVASTRNGMDPSIVPQGLMAPMMPLPFDVSGMSTTPLDVHRPGPVPMSTLASVLSSATPENQRMVSFLILSLHFSFHGIKSENYFEMLVLDSECLQWPCCQNDRC